MTEPSGPPDRTRTPVCVDRIEGDCAVLQLEDEREVEVPLDLLPEGVREGSWLTWDLRLDPGRTERMRRDAAALRSRLSRDDDGGDFSL